MKALEPLRNALQLLQDKITAYAGGDRPPSPPAWMLQLETMLDASLAEATGYLKQGQADWRAACDALTWAHEFHGLELPPANRAVAALIAHHDEHHAKEAQWKVKHLEALRAKTAAESALAEYQRWDADLAIAAAKAIHRNVRTELELLEARELADARRVQLVNAETAYMDRERDYQRLKALQFEVPREVLERALKALEWADRWMTPIHGAYGAEDQIPASANELSKYLKPSLTPTP